MAFNPKRTFRQLHYWGSIIIAAPLLLVVCTGLLLQIKKQVAWVQPPTQTGAGVEPGIDLAQILAAAATAPAAEIHSWEDIERIDVRPAKGVIKVRGHSRWEVQVDAATGAVLQVAYRRSDLIESLHDGSFFHDAVKLWVFLPTGVLLLGMWLTGMYLFLLPMQAKRRKRQRDPG